MGVIPVAENTTPEVVSAQIVSGTSKSGKEYKAIQFTIITRGGVYRSPLVFPSDLELVLIQEAINPMKEIYG